jgi:integrase
LRALEQPNRRARPLSNESINKTLKTLSQVADDAIDHGHMASNPARGKSANISNRVLAKAIERANARLEEAGMPSIAAGLTNHTLRRTFASLLYEGGATPAYVMAQMGHESAERALEIYAKVMDRKRDTGERVDAFDPRR